MTSEDEAEANNIKITIGLFPIVLIEILYAVFAPQALLWRKAEFSNAAATLPNEENASALAEVAEVAGTPPEPPARDPRAEALEAYLKRQNTEFYLYADKIVELGDFYSVDYRIIVAIAGVESGYCRVNFKPNNCWGYGNFTWENLDIAIDEYYRKMHKYYFSRGRTTPESIAAIYNPTPDEYIRKLYIHLGKIP